MALHLTKEQVQLDRLSHANWSRHYLTKEGDINNKCVLGRIIKLLHLKSIPWIRSLLQEDVDISKSRTAVEKTIIASMKAQTGLSQANKADLHRKAIDQYNSLIDYVNKKRPESQKLAAETKINLQELEEKAAKEQDLPSGEEKENVTGSKGAH